jgi:hypothetical protein
MEHLDYEYTVGMTDEEIASHLGDHRVGVLSLANDGDAYAIPVDYRYADGRLLLRLTDDGDSKKIEYAGATQEACFLLYDPTPDASWSIVALGTLGRLGDSEHGDFADETLNEWFDRLHIFDEDVDDLSVAVYELYIDSLTGRKTSR